MDAQPASKLSKKRKRKREGKKDDASDEAGNTSSDSIVCYFSDASYLRVLGPPPPFEQRFLSLLEQFRAEKEKNPTPKHKDMDKPKESKASPKGNFQKKMKALHEQVLSKRTVLGGQWNVDQQADGEMDDNWPENQENVNIHDTKTGGKETEYLSSESEPNQDNNMEVSKNLIYESQPNQDNNMEVSKNFICKSQQKLDNHMKVSKNLICEAQPNQDNSMEVSKDLSGESEPNQDINKEVSTNLICESQPNQDNNMEVSSNLICESETHQDNNIDVSEELPHEYDFVKSNIDSQNNKIDNQNVEMETSPDDVLCLIMPSLSDDEDAPENIFDFQPTSENNKDKKLKQSSGKTDTGSVDVPLSTTACLRSQQPSAEINNVGADSSICASAAALETHSQQHFTEMNKSTDFSEQDIPIFSIREEVPPETVWAAKANAGRKTCVWAIERKDQCTDGIPKSIRGDASVQDDLNSFSFKRSELTMAEHANYLRLYNKYVKPFLHTRPPQISSQQQIQELSTLQSLQRRVGMEQEEYQKYLHKLALRNPNGYGFLKSGARRYSLSKASAYRLKRNYELKFSSNPKYCIPFSSRSQGAELTFCQTLLEVGAPPKIVLPSIQPGGKPVLIPHDFKKLDSHFPRITNRSFPGYIHHEPVSEDGNMKALVIKHGVHVAMSSGTFVCLINNHAPGFAKAWNIPVTIELCQSGGTSRKVIFLDKPLFEDDLITRDYNTLYHKYALRTFISQPKIRSNRNLRSGPCGDHVKAPGSADKFYDDTFDIFSTPEEPLETFGTGLPLSVFSGAKGKESHSWKASKEKSSFGSKDSELKVKKANPETKGNDSAKDAVTDQKGLRHAGEGSHESDSPSSPSAPLSPSPASPPSSPLKFNCVREIPLSPVKTGQHQQAALHSPVFLSPKAAGIQQRSTRSLPAKTGRESMHSSGESLLSPLDSILGQAVLNQSNSSFKVPREDPSQYIPPTEDCSSLMYNLFTSGVNRVLIRCRSHGVLKDPKKPRQIYVHPKLEYQTMYGYEQATLKEVVKSWASCYTRQKTNLLRVRINSFTSEIMMYEELEPHQILGSSFNFQPKAGFQFLDDLLNHLMSLDCGNYLLSHDVGADFCALRSPKTVGSDERVSVKQIIPDITVPWVPIDPTLLTSLHIAHERIPATFLPKDYVHKKKKEQENQKGNKHNKGKKFKGQGKQGKKNKNNAGKNYRGKKK